MLDWQEIKTVLLDMDGTTTEIYPIKTYVHSKNQNKEE